MMRVILTPPVLSADALGELQDWLGITTGGDAGELSELLMVAIGVCTDFTGLVPIACTCQETLPLPPPAPRPLPLPLDWRDLGLPPGFAWPPGAGDGFQPLATRPVTAVTAVKLLDSLGNPTPITPPAYTALITADGTARISVPQPGVAIRCQVQFTAGYAPSWDALPDPLRHGIVRLAAHQYRNRDAASAAPLPPAAVAALWLPWRRLKLG